MRRKVAIKLIQLQQKHIIVDNNAATQVINNSAPTQILGMNSAFQNNNKSIDESGEH